MSMHPWDPPEPGDVPGGPVPPSPWAAGSQPLVGAWTPPPRRPSRAALDPGAVRDAVVAGASAAVAALVVASAVVAVVAVLASDASGDASSGGEGPAVWHLVLWITGMAFGVPLVVHAAGWASSFAAGSVAVTVHVPVPLVLAVACLVAAVLTVRSQRRRPVAEPVAALAASGCAAVVPFVLGLVLSFASTTSTSATSGSLLPLSGGVTVGLAHVRAGLYEALVVFAVTLGARLAAGGVRMPVAGRRLQLGSALRAVGDHLLVTAALTSLVALVAGLATLPSAGAALGIWALTLPGAGVLGAQLAAFAPLQVTGWSAGGLTGPASQLGGGLLSGRGGSVGGSTSFSLYGGQLSAWWWLLLLVPVAGVLVAGLRHTLSRAPSVRPPWASAATSAAVLVVALFVADRYLQVEASASGLVTTSVLGGGTGIAVLGVGIGGLGYLSAAVVGGAIPLAGWVLAPVLYRRAPRLLRAAAYIPVPAPVVLAALPQRPGAVPAPWPVDAPQGPPPGYRAPAVPSGLPTPVRGRSPLVIGVVVAAVVVAAVGGLLLGRSTGGGAGAAPAGPPVAAPSIGTPTPAPATASPTDPVVEAPSATAPSTPAVPTVSPGGIDLGAVADDPAAAGVVGTLDTYFTSVNAHDGAEAVSVFDPSGAVDPANPAQVAKFQHDISTSTDDRIVVHGIQPDPADPGGYLAALTFRSRQSPAFGPGGNESCTNWSLTYRLTAQFKLLRSQGASHTAC